MHNPGLTLVKKHSVSDADLDAVLESELANFARELAIARAFLKQFPELVHAKRFPARLRGAYVKEFKQEPTAIELASLLMEVSPEARESFRKDLEESLRRRERNEA